MSRLFININNWDCAYDVADHIQYAAQKGMSIGSHTATHPHMLDLTYDQVDEQIDIVNTFMLKVIGVKPRYLRFPYGETNQTLNDYVWNKHRLHVVDWSIDSGDADGASVEQSIKTIEDSILQGGHIVLNHETHESSIKQVAPKIIERESQPFSHKDLLMLLESPLASPTKGNQKC